MKKFAKNLGIFLFPILFIGILFEGLIRKIPNDYLIKKEYLDQNAQNTRVLFIGNSHVYYGIDPKYIQSSFNASYISQSYDYDLAILKKYEKEWTNLKYMIIPVDYLSFYGRIETGIEAWRIKNYRIYYNINIDHKIYNAAELLSNKLEVNLKRVENYYLKAENDVSSSSMGWGTNFNAKNNNNLIETGMAAAKRHKATDNLSFDENVKLLLEIISFAENKGVKVILFTSPAYQSYVKNLNPAQLNATIAEVNKIVQAHPRTIYHNLLQDSSFIAQDFFDADHLNEIGAKKLSLKINSWVKGHH